MLAITRAEVAEETPEWVRDEHLLARRPTSSDTQRDLRRLNPKAMGFQALVRLAERLAASPAVARLAGRGRRPKYGNAA
jgi:hypothetical protein